MLSLMMMHQLVSAIFILLSSVSRVVESDCSGPCTCDLSPPSCPPGVSWVSDECACCKLCARQFNQDCSAREPCDHIKGLHCHLGAGGDPEKGLCRAEAQGRPCEFSGRVYQHGEDFQPSCQHQCSCMDGVVGCMPLCPHQMPLPDWRCSRPRLARLPGGCCEEWLCDDSNHISEVLQEPALPDSQPHPNHIRPQLQAKPQPWSLPQTQTDYQASTGVTFREAVSLPGDEVGLAPRCFPQTTGWTECSTSCGMGVSSRVTNANSRCRLVRETRLCQIRQCDPEPTSLGKRGKKCQRTARPEEPVRITFAGCSTARRYRPRTCGACTDGRCCSPSLSRTVNLRFHCPDGEGFSRNVMWIQRCSCRKMCHRQSSPSRPFISLHNDIHTFRH